MERPSMPAVARGLGSSPERDHAEQPQPRHQHRRDIRLTERVPTTRVEHLGPGVRVPGLAHTTKEASLGGVQLGVTGGSFVGWTNLGTTGG